MKGELLKILEANNIITSEQAEKILAETGGQSLQIEKALLKQKLIEEEELAEYKAKVLNLPYIDLSEQKIADEVLNIFSSDIAKNYQIICFAKEAGKIKVGITDPGNFKAIEAIDFLAKGNKLSVEYYLISEKSFTKVFKQYKSFSREITSALKKRATEEEKNIQPEDKGESLEEVTRSAPVVKIVSVIIRHAVEGSASDIHIEPLKKETRVRYRIDGVLYTSLVLPRNVHNSIVARIKVMANLKLDETRIPQDGRIRLNIDNRDIDFRVSILPLVGSEKVVMRVLETERGAPKLEDLGFQGEQLEILNSCIKETEGLILVTGPTGSGKSTTLFSLIERLNKEGVNISTLEDPVEYQIKGVSQSQIRPEIGYTFASGLRSFLRQDPDIIMVGEIRDNETAELSIHAALTGHLVLSTLHTMDSVGAVTRLLDMKVPPFLLGSTLNIVIAQRLVRKICPHCKIEVDITQDFKEEIKEELNRMSFEYIKGIIPDFDINSMKFYKGKGCSQCGNKGYSGRLAIAEVLNLNDRLKSIVMNGKIISTADVKKNQQFITIKQDGIIKMLMGQTTLEEILRVMRD